MAVPIHAHYDVPPDSEHASLRAYLARVGVGANAIFQAVGLTAAGQTRQTLAMNLARYLQAAPKGP